MVDKNDKRRDKNNHRIKYIPVKETNQYVKAVLILPKDVLIEIARALNKDQSPTL